MIASTLLSCFCFHPSKKPLDAKISHLCCGFDWGELGSSICIRLVYFIGPSFHILLNIYLFIIVCFFVMDLSMPNFVFGHWSFRPFQTKSGIIGSYNAMCPIHSHVGSLFTLWRRKRDASQLIGWSDGEELSNPAMREEVSWRKELSWICKWVNPPQHQTNLQYFLQCLIWSEYCRRHGFWMCLFSLTLSTVIIELANI